MNNALLELDDSDSDVEFLNIQNQNLERQRVYRIPISMNLNDVNFEEKFRFSREQFETQRSSALSPQHQLMCTLRFLATGKFFKYFNNIMIFCELNMCSTGKYPFARRPFERQLFSRSIPLCAQLFQ